MSDSESLRYASDYRSNGESLRYRKSFNNYKPRYMSLENWRGPVGEQWRDKAVTYASRYRPNRTTGVSHGGRKRRHGTKRRRGTKRSTRRR
jgi:hypothetical protein